MTGIPVPSPAVLEAWLAKRSLAEFMRLSSPHSAAKGITWNWHLDALADHLTAVSVGDIRHLMIWIPPRFRKSFTVAVDWPAWEWLQGRRGGKPGATQFLTASYKADLATRDAVRCRSLMASPWYTALKHAVLGKDAWEFASDQNVKKRYENTNGGHRIAIGVGTGTGEDSDIRIIDDAHNVTDSESDTKRESVVTWYAESWSTRSNNPKEVREVVMGQRTHEQDMQGRLIDEEGRDSEGGKWAVLDLPMRYEPTSYVTVLGFRDPRHAPTEGMEPEESGYVDAELLFPARWPEKEVKSLETRLSMQGPHAVAAQLQQRPAPKGGAKVQEAMFAKRWSVWPERDEISRLLWYFDLSFGSKSKTASMNGAHLWADVPDWEGRGRHFLLLDRMMVKGATLEQFRLIRDAEAIAPGAEMVAEKKANGAAVVGVLTGESGEELPGVERIPGLVAKEPPKGTAADRKEVAFDATVVPLAASSSIVLPADDTRIWAKDVLKVWTRFPRIKPDEDADCASGGLWELWGSGAAQSLAVTRISAQDRTAAIKRRKELITRAKTRQRERA